tara:strand:- start:78 stop:434 length:357 start_codon:yes stop_codon:yes gene_type:complete
MFSPITAFISVLTGAIMPADNSLYSYGAAQNIMEFFLVVIACVPVSIGTALILSKSRWSPVVYPLGFISASMAPQFLAIVREDTEYLAWSVVSAFVLTALVGIYLSFAPAAKNYFGST